MTETLISDVEVSMALISFSSNISNIRLTILMRERMLAPTKEIFETFSSYAMFFASIFPSSLFKID